MKKNVLLIACIAIFACVSCAKRITKADQISIIPVPVSVTESDGIFELTPKTKVILLSDQKELAYSVNFLSSLLQPAFGTEIVTQSASLPLDGAVNVSVNPSLAASEYIMKIDPKIILIEGGSPQGVYYAFQTLRQLIPAQAFDGSKVSAIELPAVEITDKPHFEHRGGMLDVSRHFFSTDDVKKFIDILAMHKMNKFHWHLTDDQGWRIEIKKYPELTKVGSVREKTLKNHLSDSIAEYDETPYGGFYTQDQIKDIVQYASERFITVIPEIEIPGHAIAALASYPELGCRGKDYAVRTKWGIADEAFCAGKEETFTFIEGVLSEVVELFPSEYIHIGGDECRKGEWKQCPMCQKRIKDEKLKDEFELQSYVMHRVEKFVNSKGRKIIGWDEILEGGLSKSATVMSWRGTQGGITAAKAGNTVIMAPYTYCYLDYYQTDKKEGEPLSIGGFLPLEKVYELDPYDQLTDGQKQYILGVQGNLWTEYIGDFNQVEYMLLPRLAAIAERGWAYNKPNFEDFSKRLVSLEKIYDVNGYNYFKPKAEAPSEAAKK